MSSRKGVGLSAFSRNAIRSDKYASHGASMRSANAESLATQLSVFQAALYNFSLTHGAEIRSNPTFRAEFARMCNAIGVDPLASSHHRDAKGKTSSKGSAGGSFWSQMLGENVNDFYFDLAVRVVHICRQTRGENGGMIAISDICKRIEHGSSVGGGIDVSEDDIVRAVKSLEPLGSGFVIMKLGARTMIRSIPKELNNDQSTVLEAIQVLGYASVSMLQANLNWERPRSVAVLDDLVSDALVWVDTQADEKEYWSPTMINAFSADTSGRIAPDG